MSVIDHSLETLDLFGFKTIGFREAYNEPHRAYHDISHMAFILTAIEEMRDMYKLRQDDYLTLLLAAWYHDLVYEPGSSTNEERSADIASEALGNGSYVPEMVLLTKSHRDPVTFIEGLLIDADLSGLGFPWQIYSVNKQNIRYEYSAYSDEEWREGRKFFLENKLNYEMIFYTSWGGRYERFARRNMERELMIITQGSDKVFCD